MKLTQIAALSLSILFLSCGNKNQSNTAKKTAPVFTNKGHELVYKMVEKAGNYAALLKHKDVVYTYTYTTPDGKTDISTEKYIFDGELSYAKYHQHQRTLPELEGAIEQSYDGKEFWVKNNNELQTDPKSLKRAQFSRPTNFYWFTMLQKLLDPGVNYEFLGEKTIDEKAYNIVKISFTSTDDKPTDIYQLYINKETQLIDQFLFTVADFGVIETPFLMQLEYEKIENLLIPTKRQYKKSTWSAEVSDSPWIYVNWTNIKFNNGLKREDFKK
ncbi:DUF6503 family protein [Flavicella sediminum]|uniref:DUF6503 family protein n=1 Tax=Flavicella sediminum TaxID=2585141 RepID=UPI00111E4C0B|nr:DUF6503 family protein [Flavicella sediminum]